MMANENVRHMPADGIVSVPESQKAHRQLCNFRYGISIDSPVNSCQNPEKIPEISVGMTPLSAQVLIV